MEYGSWCQSGTSRSTQCRKANRTMCDAGQALGGKGTLRAELGFTRESNPVRLEMDVANSSSW
eukprot:6437388-Prorocentrum_lima.AAC.1